MQHRHQSHRAGPVDRATLCLMFRANRSKYRHRRGLWGPLLHMLLGIPERRTHYRQYRDYDPNLSRRQTRPARHSAATSTGHAAQPAPTASQERPLTLAEQHAAEFRQGHTASGRSTGTGRASTRLTSPRTNQATSSTGATRDRNFHEKRPSERGIQTNLPHQSHGNQKFQPLPQPTGQSPYHLSLSDVLPADQIAAIEKSGRMMMHVVGDTGGVKAPQSQLIVAMGLESHFNFPDITMRPAFFYNLGDVVYYYGEAKEYFAQFYDPYIHYPAPIFAIPGNHDGDVTDGSAPSLTAFVENFCAASPHTTPEAGETQRDAMTQPHVYWTLEAPYVNIIGLYSNVPEGGELDEDQINWFINELRTAPKDKALFVTVHHPAYSADSHHSGSQYIQATLDRAFGESGRTADMVLSGHVHNYQRFTRNIDGRHVPYIVAGAGGYWHLHYMAKMADGSPSKTPMEMPDPNLMLENACDDHHGFLRLMATPRYITGEYWIVSRPQESWRAPAQRLDAFALDLQTHRIVKGTAFK